MCGLERDAGLDGLLVSKEKGRVECDVGRREVH